MIHLHPWTSLKQSWPVRKSEWVLALMTFGLWFVFSLNDDLFSDSVAYAGLARWASQTVWAWMFFVVGLSRLIVLFINGAYWRSPHWRAALAFLNCFAWYQLAVGLSANMGIGLIVFPGILVLDVLNFRQAFLEAAASEGLKDGERSRLRPHS